MIGLDQFCGLFPRRHGISAVVIGDEFHLAAVDPAFRVDHVEIGRLGPTDGAEGSKLAGVGHDIADANVEVEHFVRDGDIPR